MRSNEMKAAALRPLAIGLGLVVGLGTFLAAQPATAAGPESSAVTVSASSYDPDAANSPTPNLKVTVSQTQNLIQQGVTVSWTGGKQSQVPNQQTGGKNFLQIAQCWGDEPGSNGTRPDRTTCQYGGLALPGDSRWSNIASGAQVASQDTAYTAAGAGWWEPTMTSVPFRSATGATVANIVDGKRVSGADDPNSNEFFTKFTTNEVSWAGSGADGSGSVSFELQTVQQSPGLGCGTAITAADGTVTGSSCWLVVIPRGDTDPGASTVTQSGLLWQNWEHHIAVRLDFRPSGLRCAIGAAERQLSGSELVAGAVGQWQPKLCNSTDGAVYSLLTGPESDAATAANGTTAAPMALTSRALSDGSTDSLAYAPVALTGISIAFSIDRQANATGAAVPDAVTAKERLAFESLKLTPRLLAKLLTASYTDALPTGADWSHVSGVRNITQDPEFLAINDKEWSYMRIVGPGVGDALVSLGRSDTARAVWEYILADPDAASFLAGKADPWGMKVNPYYSTNAKVNPTGTALELPRDDFPKADPIEFKGYANNHYADSVNLVTWRPYTSSLDASGYQVLRGDAQVLGSWDPNSVPPKYGKAERSLVGLQAVIGVTDTAAAAKYQVVQAALRNSAGKYVVPTVASMTAAATAMTKDAHQSQVVRLDPTSSKAKAATAAYPLTMPVYAAVNPAMSGSALRADYAEFITMAVTSGQTSGTEDGQLPPGYAPLPAAWKTQALAAASAIKNGKWPSSTTTPSASPSASASSRPSATSTTSGSSIGSQPFPTGQPAASAGASASAENPSASGSTAGSLSGTKTPDDPGLGALAAVVPASATVGIVAGIGVPLVSRFRRRRL